MTTAAPGGRWEQVKTAYPLWEAPVPNGTARVWWNEGASPGWGWQVISARREVIAGGIYATRAIAERAALAAGGM